MQEKLIKIPQTQRTFLILQAYAFFAYCSTFFSLLRWKIVQHLITTNRIFDGFKLAIRDVKVRIFMLMGCSQLLGLSFINFFPT